MLLQFLTKVSHISNEGKHIQVTKWNLCDIRMKYGVFPHSYCEMPRKLHSPWMEHELGIPDQWQRYLTANGQTGWAIIWTIVIFTLAVDGLYKRSRVRGDLCPNKPFSYLIGHDTHVVSRVTLFGCQEAGGIPDMTIRCENILNPHVLHLTFFFNASLFCINMRLILVRIHRQDQYHAANIRLWRVYGDATEGIYNWLGDNLM